MAKRFTDTNKYKKTFFRSLPAAYKLFWDFLYHECDNAGIWHVDFEIAQIYIGKDAPISQETALRLFNEGEERIKVLEQGAKWFVVPFIPFQYRELTEKNSMHRPIIATLGRYDLRGVVGGSTLLQSPFEGASIGAMDMDMDYKGGHRGKNGSPNKASTNGNSKTTATEVYTPPAPDTPAYVVHAYKKLTGVPEDDRSWDRIHYARCMAAAKTLVQVLGSPEKAITCMGDVSASFGKKGLSWTLETIVKRAHDWKVQMGEI